MIGVASDGEIGGMSGNTQSLLSALATPPKKRGEADGVALAVTGWIVGGVFGMLLAAIGSETAGFIAFLIIGLASTVGGIALHRANDKWNKWQYPPLYRKWKSSWLCKRCGCTWQRSD
jgi:MFS family permease